MTSQSPSKEAPWDLTLFSQFTLSYFTESHWWSEMSSLLKVILVWGKAKSHRAPRLGCRGAETPRWFDVLPKNSAWDMMHEGAHCCDEAANCQLPIAAPFWIIQIVSTEECSSFVQNLMLIFAVLAQSFWMWQPHSTHAHSEASTAPTD